MARTAKNEQSKETVTIDSVFSGINQKLGQGTIYLLGGGPNIRATAIPTQSVGLNLALGVGGMPRGRIVEIYGKEHSGKSSIAMGVIAEAQRIAATENTGRKCAYIDPECGMVVESAKLLGVDTDDLVYSQPSCGEDALNIVESLVRSNLFDVVAVDSVAALVPQKELEGEMGDVVIGLQARLMSQAMRKLTVLTAKSDTVLIFINQLRERVGVLYGNPETTPGGNALKFYSSVRLDVRRGESIMASKQQIGHYITVKVVKNRVAPPHKKARYGVIYDEGIDLAQELVDHGVDQGILKKSGSWYTLLDSDGNIVMDNKKEVKWNGVDALRIALNADSVLKRTLLERFETKIKEVMKDIPIVDDDNSDKLTKEDCHDDLTKLEDEANQIH